MASASITTKLCLACRLDRNLHERTRITYAAKVNGGMTPGKPGKNGCALSQTWLSSTDASVALSSTIDHNKLHSHPDRNSHTNPSCLTQQTVFTVVKHRFNHVNCDGIREKNQLTNSLASFESYLITTEALDLQRRGAKACFCQRSCTLMNYNGKKKICWIITVTGKRTPDFFLTLQHILNLKRQCLRDRKLYSNESLVIHLSRRYRSDDTWSGFIFNNIFMQACLKERGIFASWFAAL